MVPPPRILAVDDDAWILRMVTSVLDKRGYETIVAHDGEEGYRVAMTRRPDLVITDIMMPRMDGWTLVKHLRSRPEFALVPVIFLTALNSDADRIKGFRLGADDYLAKPFRFEELELRVANALKKHAADAPIVAEVHAATPSPGASGLRGTLDQIGLPSVLTILEMERKSGVLVLGRSDETARLFIQKGRVVRARFDGRPAPVNADAVYELLTWSTGRFEFTALDVDMKDEVNQTTTGLLMEGARRIDEAAEAGRR